MARGKQFTPEVKAQALALRVAGQSPREIAAATGVHENTIGEWYKALPTSTVTKLKRDQRVDELLQGYLEAVLVALTVQAEVFADRAWIAKANAQQLGILHGIIADKAFRIVEAKQWAESNDGSEEEGGEEKDSSERDGQQRIIVKYVVDNSTTSACESNKD
jgi:hypothetical protein